jgi:putative aldouronate transport system substrate-binding protein
MTTKAFAALFLALVVGIVPCALFASGGTEATAPAAGGKMLAEPVTLTLMNEEHPAQPLKVDSPVVKEIEKRLNIVLKIEPVPAAGYPDKKKALLATNSIPDIMRVDAEDIQLFARSGVFVAISDYAQLTPDFGKLAAERPDIRNLKVDGKLYGFPMINWWRVGFGYLPAMRVDLLEKQKIAVPATFEDLLDAFKKLKAAYPETIGVTVRNGTKYLLGEWAYSFGSGGFTGTAANRATYFEPATGRYVCGPADPAFARVVAYMNQLYAAGSLDRDYAVNKQDQLVQKLTTGKATFTWDNTTFIGRVYNPGVVKTDPTARFDLLEPLRPAQGQARGYRGARDPIRINYCLSSKLDEKKRTAALKFYNWMYSPEGSMITNFGTDGEHFDMVGGKPVVRKDLIDRFAGRPDQINAIQSSVGTGILAFAVYVHDGPLAQLSQPDILAHGSRVDAMTDKGLVHYQLSDPPFTKDEADALKKLEPALDLVFSKGIDRFITGERPMGEWESFRQELIKAGAPEIERIYNAALARTK